VSTSAESYLLPVGLDGGTDHDWSMGALHGPLRKKCREMVVDFQSHNRCPHNRKESARGGGVAKSCYLLVETELWKEQILCLD